MDPLTDRETLRSTLAAFDQRQKKILGGLIAVMIENPDRVREREWIVEQFTQVVLLAGDFEDVSGVQEATETVQAYAQANIHTLLNASYQLFYRVAEDLAPRVAEGLSREDAMAQALSYFVEAPE